MARAQLLAAGVSGRRSGVRSARAGCTASIRACTRLWRRNCSPRKGTSSPPCWPRARARCSATGRRPGAGASSRPSLGDAVGGATTRDGARACSCTISAPAPRRHHPQRPLPDHHRPAHAARPRDPLRPRALLRALAEAEFHHDLRPADIERTLRRGHPGSANLRAALRAHVPGHGQAKSQLERRFRALLIRHGIELPERNAPRRAVDGRLPVAASGGSSSSSMARQHDRPHQADVDRDRDLWLRAHGHIVRRYGHRQIDERPDDVIADLLDALGG